MEKIIASSDPMSAYDAEEVVDDDSGSTSESEPEADNDGYTENNGVPEEEEGDGYMDPAPLLNNLNRSKTSRSFQVLRTSGTSGGTAAGSFLAFNVTLS
jgi:hypothetical protein